MKFWLGQKFWWPKFWWGRFFQKSTRNFGYAGFLSKVSENMVEMVFSVNYKKFLVKYKFYLGKKFGCPRLRVF